ncbi:uncharacterized protein LOC101863802 isoform X2 [Aplysia californica]|uniref:Uncharacterized protein LOC101863802 isoform X2 n=1 Tax=Aplysia californica TaxID=6500 RepID=A0ABM0JHJ0_APLCA|nr:uncharacterized protein LOC101863802 isoform X2 [Aplysia californica]
MDQVLFGVVLASLACSVSSIPAFCSSSNEINNVVSTCLGNNGVLKYFDIIKKGIPIPKNNNYRQFCNRPEEFADALECNANVLVKCYPDRSFFYKTVRSSALGEINGICNDTKLRTDCIGNALRDDLLECEKGQYSLQDQGIPRMCREVRAAALCFVGDVRKCDEYTAQNRRRYLHKLNERFCSAGPRMTYSTTLTLILLVAFAVW